MGQITAGWHITGIALSGSAARPTWRASREPGFAAHLVKPVDLDGLIAVIDEVMAG
jgi:hypothetical protein